MGAAALRSLRGALRVHPCGLRDKYIYYFYYHMSMSSICAKHKPQQNGLSVVRPHVSHTRSAVRSHLLLSALCIGVVTVFYSVRAPYDFLSYHCNHAA